MTRALLVDDQREIRRVLQMLLEQIGIESVPAESGEAAMKHFAAAVAGVLDNIGSPRLSASVREQ